MRDEGMKAVLDREELLIQKKMRESLSRGKAELWPSVKRAIAKEDCRTGNRVWRTMRFPGRAWVPAAILAMALCVMGAGILRHWYVYDSSGSRTALAEGDGFDAGEGYAVMLPSADHVAAEEIRIPYDRADDPAFIPGGLQIPGNTEEERDIPELKEKLRQLPPGTYAEISANGMTYAAVQGHFTADYEECRKMPRGMCWGSGCRTPRSSRRTTASISLLR